MDEDMLIYFAAPLFSEAERRFNRQLTAKLEAIGYEVFLPQRDGVKEDKPPYDTMNREERRKAIFCLDVRNISDADVFLIVLDGRVPDEGACVELGIAYCQRTMQDRDVLLIGLQTDRRAAFPRSKLNAMVRVPLEYIAEDEDALVEHLVRYREGRSA
jgi:nucleoside 2-deoxyribosyltransferase